jgi:hypothetical protein
LERPSKQLVDFWNRRQICQEAVRVSKLFPSGPSIKAAVLFTQRPSDLPSKKPSNFQSSNLLASPSIRPSKQLVDFICQEAVRVSKQFPSGPSIEAAVLFTKQPSDLPSNQEAVQFSKQKSFGYPL